MNGIRMGRIKKLKQKRGHERTTMERKNKIYIYIYKEVKVESNYLKNFLCASTRFNKKRKENKIRGKRRRKGKGLRKGREMGRKEKERADVIRKGHQKKVRLCSICPKSLQ